MIILQGLFTFELAILLTGVSRGNPLKNFLSRLSIKQNNSYNFATRILIYRGPARQDPATEPPLNRAVLLFPQKP